MTWITFDRRRFNNQKLPKARYHVLLAIEGKPDQGLPPAVAVGYLKFAAGEKDSPYFVIPGVGGNVVAWCDCLPEDFTAPLWVSTGRRTP